MVYLIIIAILCLILVLFGIYHMFCMKKNAEFAIEAMERLEQEYRLNVELSNGYSELVKKYAERLDIHAQNLDALSDKNRQLNDDIYRLTEEKDQLNFTLELTRQGNEKLETENNALRLKIYNLESGKKEETTDGTEE